MTMRSGLLAAFLAIGTLAGATAAQAGPINLDLSGDFTMPAPSNGWSFTYGTFLTPPGSAVPHQATESTSNALHDAIPNPGGYYSVGGNSLNVNNPLLFKSARDGSTLTGYHDTDFLTGDVVVHSSNTTGEALWINWTAPTAGTISDLDISTWFAHSALTPGDVRSNSVILSIAGSVVDTDVVTNASDRNNRVALTGASSYAVAAGDLLSIAFMKAPTSSFGSLSGVAAAFTFTATTPIPAALPLFASALVGLGWFGRRGKKKAV
jgi:hypothetical protein